MTGHCYKILFRCWNWCFWQSRHWKILEWKWRGEKLWSLSQHHPDVFDQSQKTVLSFKKKTCKIPHSLNNEDSPFYSLLYAVSYDKTQKIEPSANNEVLKNDLLDGLYNKLSVIQKKPVLYFHVETLEKEYF